MSLWRLFHCTMASCAAGERGCKLSMTAPLVACSSKQRTDKLIGGPQATYNVCKTPSAATAATMSATPPAVLINLIITLMGDLFDKIKQVQEHVFQKNRAGNQLPAVISFAPYLGLAC